MTAVEGEGNVHPPAIVAADLKSVRAPASVRPSNATPAGMSPLGAFAGVALEQQPMRLHDAINPFGIDRRATFLAAVAPDQRMDSPVPISWKSR